jgi:hypothetical protein
MEYYLALRMRRLSAAQQSAVQGRPTRPDSLSRLPNRN